MLRKDDLIKDVHLGSDEMLYIMNWDNDILRIIFNRYLQNLNDEDVIKALKSVCISNHYLETFMSDEK